MIKVAHSLTITSRCAEDASPHYVAPSRRQALITSRKDARRSSPVWRVRSSAVSAVYELNWTDWWCIRGS